MKLKFSPIRIELTAGLATLLVLLPAGKSPVQADSAARFVPANVLSAVAQPKTPLKSFVCLSSWYGEDFDGQITANGEIYDMYAQTAAHPTLPLGSIVRVVNLRTRRSAVVRINDRGPYAPGRDLDVSYQVAKELGFAKRGTARVRVELLKVPTSKAHPAN